MTDHEPSIEMITLAGGPTIPVALHWQMNVWESRELFFDVRHGQLVVAPARRLTKRDRELIRTYYKHIVAVVRYCREDRAPFGETWAEWRARVQREQTTDTASTTDEART